jgi:hypothetical protein
VSTRSDIASLHREPASSFGGDTAREIADRFGVTFQAILKAEERTVRALWLAGVVARRVGDGWTGHDWLTLRSIAPGQAGLVRCLSYQRWLEEQRGG